MLLWGGGGGRRSLHRGTLACRDGILSNLSWSLLCSPLDPLNCHSVLSNLSIHMLRANTVNHSAAECIHVYSRTSTPVKLAMPPDGVCQILRNVVALISRQITSRTIKRTGDWLVAMLFQRSLPASGSGSGSGCVDVGNPGSGSGSKRWGSCPAPTHPKQVDKLNPPHHIFSDAQVVSLTLSVGGNL